MNDATPDPAGPALTQVLHRVLGVADHAQDRLRLLRERHPGDGGLDAAARFLQQCQPDIALELRHLLADR